MRAGGSPARSPRSAPGEPCPGVHEPEIADVRWFDRTRIAEANSLTSPTTKGEPELLLPPLFSIARHLIVRWLSGADG